MAVIKSVRVAAAHEGIAELIETLQYQNGGVTDMVLDRHAVHYLFEACETSSPEDLIGQSWTLVKEAIEVSYRRLQ